MSLSIVLAVDMIRSCDVLKISRARQILSHMDFEGYSAESVWIYIKIYLNPKCRIFGFIIQNIMGSMGFEVRM
jgi:hypothetical protein